MGRYLGVDLGATNIKMVVLEFAAPEILPRVVFEESLPTRGEEGHDVVIDRLVAAGRSIIADHGPVEAVGLGTPGLFDGEGVVTLFTNLPGQWVGVPLHQRMVEGFGVPVTLINDARAFTLAEGRMGAGRGRPVVACVTLGTGIGGGIMIDGHLHRGAFGVAGEIAHQTVLPDGRLCGCGNRGCAEAMARSDVLADLAGKATVREVFEGLAEGDPRCQAAVDEAATYLGIALANVVTVLGPHRIVVGGGIAAAGDAFLDPLREATRRRVTLVPRESIEIVPAELGSRAGAIGAGLAAAGY